MPYGIDVKSPEYALVTTLTLLSAEKPRGAPKSPCLTLRFDLG